MERQKCFADNEKNCTALKEKNCENCKFYRTDLQRGIIEWDITIYGGRK